MLSSKKTNGKIPWGLLGIEAILVILSVLLALGLNSWRESRANQELALRALQGVIDEFHTNCSRVENFHPYHQEVADNERDPAGIQIGLIRNDSWNSAQSTGAAAYIDYDIAATIEKIYALQGDHRTFVQSYMQALFNNIVGQEEPERMHEDGEVAVIREMVRIQDSLLETYRDLQWLVDEHYAGKIDIIGFCEE